MERSGFQHLIAVLLGLLVVSIATPIDARTVILKLRSEASISSPSSKLRNVISSVSRTNLQSASRIYKRASAQTPQSVSDIGLSRIIQLEVNDNINVDSLVSILQRFEEIEYAQPNYIYRIDAAKTPNDSLFSEQWSHPNIGVQKAWQITKGKSSVKIGFIDTGVEWDHPDLVGQFAVNTKEDINGNGLFDGWKSTEEKKDARGKLVKGDLDGIDNDGNGYIDDVIGYDFVDQEQLNFGDVSNRDAIPTDENKHGTAVAGVIGAKENNTIGVAGIAPECRMVVLRAFDASGNAEDDDIASAIIYAADNNVKILNLSFGDIVPSLLQRDAIRYATSKGTLVFASSGNRGGNAHHYPSDFDECVSVGATTINEDGKGDFIYGFNTHGQGMDLVAPGGAIYTADLDGKYQVISGTSFSSPAAASVAGLLLAKDSTLTPRALRSIIESTTHDISPAGYDNLSANGRLDAYAALSYIGSAAIKLSSPHTNDGFHIGDVIEITGAAAHSLFTGYTVSFAKGLNPADAATWAEISSSTDQIIDGTLGSWNTNGLQEGTYTLRLAVTTTDGRSVQERINIELKTFAPSLLFAKIDTGYINGKKGLLLRAKTDTLTTATFYYKAQSEAAWKARKDDRFTKEHFTLLESKDVATNTPIDIRIALLNAAKDSVITTAVTFLPNEAVTQTGFAEKNYTLPLGYFLDSVLATPAGDMVTMSVFAPSSDFGPIGTYTFDKTKKQFSKTDSVNGAWVPRNIGNTSGDDKPELLLQAGNDYLLFKANSADPLVGNIILADTSGESNMFAMGLGDVDGDGKDEIVTKEKVQSGSSLTEVIRVRRRVGTTTEILGTLPNTTLPAPQYSSNNYSKPFVVFNDFTGDGVKDLAIIDDDADLLVYQYDASAPDKFKAIYTEENDAATDGSMITTGDFNGDGKEDIAYAYRPSFIENRDNEYEFPFWTLSVSLGNSNGTFTKAGVEKFAYARPSSPTRSSIGAMKVLGNGRAQIAASFFPDMYLFDMPSGSLKPVWHFPLSVTSRIGLAHDFDANGKNELAITAADATYFFERSDDIATRTPSPAGLEALPRDIDDVELRWSIVEGAEKYYILRAPDEQGAQYEIIDSATTTSYHDRSVDNETTYIYSVVARDNEMTIPESAPAFGVSAFVHPKPRIMSVTSDGITVRAVCSEPLMKSALDGGGVLVSEQFPTTIAIASDSVLVLTLTDKLVGGPYFVRVLNERIRDKWNSPLDTLPFSWQYDEQFIEDKFYITKWKFENPQLIHVTFNQQPSDNGLEISRYTLSPYGTIVNIYRDNADANSLYLELDKNFQYVALGTEFMLCVRDVTSMTNIPLSVEGDCIGATLTEPDLANVMVYPNPAHTKDEKMTFARLTADAEVSIYTMNQRFIRRLKTTGQKGGVEWDMRDDNGAILPSGIYLYSVTGKNDNGEAVESNQAKFVIINDK